MIGEGSWAPTQAPRSPSEQRRAILRSLARAALATLSTLAVLVATMVAASSALVQHTNGPHLVAWMSGFLASAGVPLALAYWRYPSDHLRMWETMSWLPAAWVGVMLVLAMQLAPRALANAVGEMAMLIEQPLGETDEATRIIDALGSSAASRISETNPASLSQHPPDESAERGRAEDLAIEIPFGEGGNGIFVDIELEGPKARLRQRYLFDTGASYTTMTTELAEKLGIEIRDDAPTLEFNTAAGPRRSKMVYLPYLHIGNQTVSGVLVSICDACATSRYPGLLGINVMREFYVDMDHRAQKMRLVPRVYDGPANRAYDIEPTLELSIAGRPELWLRHVRWKALIRNRGTVPVFNVVPRVEFSNGTILYGRKVDRIDAGRVGQSLIRGRATKDARPSVEFTLSLASAQW